MGLFDSFKNKGGESKPKVGLISDIIRCDEESYLIWKWHPKGAELGQHNRENSIRRNSSLRVKDGEVAVFVYKQKDGSMQDFIEGPFDQSLKTANMPILSGIIGALNAGDTPFQAEVYFINLANVIQVKFAVPFFDVSEPRFPDFAVPVAVRGTITFKINDYKNFIKLHRLISFDLEAFKKQIKDAVAKYVKSQVTNAPYNFNIPVIQIERGISYINDAVETELKKRLSADFGVDVSGVDIESIELDKSSSGYKNLMSVTQDITKRVAEQTSEMDLKHREDSLRIQREESQYAMHKQTQTANLGAFQIEKQVEVGVAGASALGKMGQNGAGSVNLGGGSTGFNPAAMMASIAVGSAVGQNIANTMNNSMSGINTMGAVQTPPPVPVSAFNVAVDGKSTGPYDVATLTTMANNGQINADTMVWKQGMSNWAKAGTVDELKGLFAPPII